MTRSPLILLAALLPLFALAGCSREAALEGDGLAADIATGETITVHLYQLSQGMETQAFSCEDDDDGVEVDDPTVVLVTPLGVEEVRTINQQRPVAMKFALTGLKDGRVALTSRCNGYTSSRYLYVR